MSCRERIERPTITIRILITAQAAGYLSGHPETYWDELDFNPPPSIPEMNPVSFTIFVHFVLAVENGKPFISDCLLL